VDKLINVGIPSISLGPAVPRRFKELTGLTELVIPVRGSWPAGFSKEGSYDICPQEGTFLFGLVTEALLAHEVYPSLEENQLYIVAGVELAGETLTVIGKIVEVLT